MHGVREALLIRQAEEIGIPLYQVRLPEMPGMKEYDDIMRGHMARFKGDGITHAIFGDIFLEDLKKYRDQRLAEAGMTGIYPLWKRDTHELINEFLSLGFGTVIACTQEPLGHLAGQEITPGLIAGLPPEIDVCGENGEFHTFAFKGPIFKNTIRYRTGEKIFKEYNAPKNADDTCLPANDTRKKNGFWYCDLLEV